MRPTSNGSRLFVEIIAIVAVAEVAVVYVRHHLAPHVEGIMGVILDTAAGVLLSAPFILWRIRRATERAEGVGAGAWVSGRWRDGVNSAAVLLLGVSLTAMLVEQSRTDAHHQARERFDRLAERLTTEAQRRVNLSTYGLRALTGLYAASRHIDREEFHAFFTGRDLAREFPGTLGFGFIERVMRPDVEEFVAAQQADGAPDFNVRTAGDAPDLYVVKFVEPLGPNRAALGYDLGADPTRRAAAEHAVACGAPTLTGRITLLQDEAGRPGFLYLLPVYRHGARMDTNVERETALVGLVYAPLVVERLFAGLFEFAEELVDLDVFDGRGLTAVQMIVDTGAEEEGSGGGSIEAEYRERMFHELRQITIAGREWTLALSTTPKFETTARASTATMLGTGGTLLSILLAAVVWMLDTGRARAAALARAMTSDLLAAKTRAEVALREVEALRRTIDEQSLVSIADPEGRIVDVNGMFCRLSGYSREELLGKDHRILNSGRHPRSFWQDLWKTITGGTPWRGEICNRAKDGTLFWLDTTIAPFLNAAGDIEKYVSVYTDITERKRAEAVLRESEERFRLLFESSPTAHVLINPEDLSVTACNEAAAKLLGYTPTEFIRLRIPDFDVRQSEADTRRLVQQASGGARLQFETQQRAKSGELRDVVVSCQAVQVDGQTLLLGTWVDITARKQVENELRVAARTDRLTALPNRALFHERLEHAVRRTRLDSRYCFAVLFLDLDRFKIINDSIGHDMGDMLLRQIAERLRSAIRPSDSLSREARGHTAARLGGDEFVLLLDNLASTDDAQTVAGRLLRVLSTPYALGQHEVYSTASIGIVTSDTGAESADEVLRNADIAMYEAKMAGKARFVVFDRSMHERVRHRHDLETDLRQALAGDEMAVVYQPIVSLRTGRVDNYEALLRWNHPGRGLVMPAEFIPIAEDTGLIGSLGEWVLRQACAQFASWRRALGPDAPAAVSVNVSRAQLVLSDLPETIRRILADTCVPPACLHLEVTESAIMREAEASKRILRNLKDVGVKIAIDDFGTGYSSLASLHQFPVDILKIDRSFIANLVRGRDFVALVQAVTQLAKNLRIAIVAEGIETVEHVELLQALDCEYGQGYLFGRPVDAALVPRFRMREMVLPTPPAGALHAVGI
ncbi:MAG: EAL domain-containing protein [Planctomycetes bacterium]|nr:EAL domain-containing protein [Planctomycetota bacterium]